jgi:predicted secreted hydrolase
LVRRRRFLAAPVVLIPGLARAEEFAPVVPGMALRFPGDHGSHPDFRIEWWYVTGWVRAEDAAELGIQVTFFRHRPRIAEANPSRFAPHQLLFAHAAVADARHGRLRHDQRAARAGFGLAEASEATTAINIADWSLALADGRYVARIAAREFALDLAFAPTQSMLLHGDAGVSQKGPSPHLASYYYSQPQLEITGTVRIAGKSSRVAGTAWLDHEWSSEFMAREAVGWDWVGINLVDGGVLMAFRMRDGDGGAMWAGGTLRPSAGAARTFAPADVRFRPQRSWRSPRTSIEYPVSTALEAGGTPYELQPLLADQELDSRASTGTLYWEGAVRALSAGREVGRGYLELTGYGKPLRL